MKSLDIFHLIYLFSWVSLSYYFKMISFDIAIVDSILICILLELKLIRDKHE